MRALVPVLAIGLAALVAACGDRTSDQTKVPASADTVTFTLAIDGMS